MGPKRIPFYEPLLECPQYTKPPEFRGWGVLMYYVAVIIKTLLRGEKKKEALKRTRLLRPDLLERPLTKRGS